MKITKLLVLSMLSVVVFATNCGKKNGDDDKNKETGDYNTGYFANEVKPSATAPACFAGAYYRKVVSSKDKWEGITGKVKLPTITFDPKRVNTAKPQQFLDNPSVYMGGSANGQETDIGMTWEVTKDANGNISADRRAFRPFLRRTSYKGTQQKAVYENAPAEAQYYWYPGDEITMTVRLKLDGVLEFTVEGAGKKFQRDFACDGYMFNSLIEFKRVNAIDQVSNEGKPAEPTNTKVDNAVWAYTKLFRNYDGQQITVPMHSGRQVDMRCPSVSNFTITATDDQKKLGAETITIDPKNN